VYETRPPVCRTWFCGWRQFKFIHSALRPDTAGVLVRVGTEDVPPTYATNVTLEFAVMRRSALKSPGLAETIAAAVNANIATFLVAVPDQPGLSSTRLLLNDALAAPVRIRDKGAVLRILDAMLTRGRKAEHRRVVLKHQATPTPP